MGKLRSFWLRLFGGRRARAEFEAEIQGHLEMHIDEGVRVGLSEDEARRQALLRLGCVEQARQAYRDRATLPTLEGVIQDARFALRQMVKAPGFTITAVLTLALGIGANTVIYALVDSILLRPLPFAHQEQLMRITGTTSTSYPKGWVRALGERTHTFSTIAGYGPDAESNLSESDHPDRVFGAVVTVNALDVLEIQPAAGAFFRPENAIAGQDNETVLSYGYWREHFGGDPSVIGREIRIDGVSRRIIGVMPAGVHFPYADTQFVIPVAFRAGDAYDPWTTFNLQMFGRLADGVPPLRAQAELRQLRAVMVSLFPWRMPDIWASDMTVVPLLEAQTGSMRPQLYLLFGAVGLILLIACANVANLMLARANVREKEIAIRGALGASGRRLIQQLLVESVVLGVAAGIVGLGAAFASLRIFIRLLPADTPRIQDVSLHWSDLLFTLGASVLAGLLFGVIPAARVSSSRALETLRLGSRTLAGKGSRFGVSTLLVVAQIGLSVLVITSAGLVLHSLYKLMRVDPGFRTDHIVTAEVSLDSGACREKGRCESFFGTLLQRSGEIAGVQRAALADALPLEGEDDNYVYDAENHPRDARQGALLARGRVVSPGYFDVLKMELVRGRLLDTQDASGATHAAAINERMAEHLWPNQDPIGKHVLNVVDESQPTVWNAAKASIVVGVVRNTHDSSLDSGYGDEVFLPVTEGLERPVMYVLLNTRTSPSETADGLRRVVSEIDSLVPVTRVRTLDDVVTTSVAAPRALAVLLLGFGALAVIIGAVGIYSLISYIVSWRVREIGLRLALGAQRWQIVMAVVRQSLLLAAAGCIAGIAGTLAFGRVLHSFLFGVSALDPLTLGAVTLMMILVALTAAWIPARRAASVDPMEALRAD
ncbi:MAG TPA: ABC transporter permease [Terracidiphilus sp.]|nr:ABC transporter permease [Terracidiphilus sp.]